MSQVEGEEVDSDASMEDMEINANEAQLKTINEYLSKNPYDYQSHVNKISLLSSLGELEELRSARETFSKLYPLSVELWLSWLQDEQRLSSTPQERKEVYHLFKRAVTDYLSVDLWIEYCSFILGDVGSPDGVQRAREVFEEAVSAVGLHVEKGHLIWGAYRDFEVAVMSLHNRGYEYVFKVFQRQLSIPLLNMEKTIEEELKDFEDIPGFSRLSASTPLKPFFANSLRKLKEREPFENELLKTKDNFDIYSKYIQAMMKDSSPPEIQILFERRITDHPLNPQSWTEYIHYMDTILKIQSLSLPVYRRAVRNTPWSGDIWCKYLRTLEQFGSDTPKITEVFEEALSSGFSVSGDYSRVWMEYIGHFRRGMDSDEIPKDEAEKHKTKLKELFERCLAHLESIPDSDPDMKISRLWASVCGDRFRDMETARKTWSNIVHVVGDQMIYWTEYIALEKLFGDGKHLRRVFLRGMEKIKDYPEYFGQLWRQFEIEEGDLSQLENAEEKIRKCLLVNEERQAKESALEGSHKSKALDKVERKKERDKEKRRDKRRSEAEEQKNNRKRKIGVVEPEGFAVVVEENSKKLPKTDNESTQDPEFKAPLPINVKETQSSGIKPPPGYKGGSVKPPPGFKEGTVKPPPGFKEGSVIPPPGFKDGSIKPPPGFTPSSDPQGTKPTSENQENTVFLSNLSFEVNEEDIQGAMETSGPIKEVRLAKSYNGKSRGFAFVEFINSSSVSKALQRDNEILKGRPLYISECNPNKEGRSFKYSTSLEKNKLFVRGLNFSSTREEIQDHFSQYGALKEVRLATFRNGKSKGIAYVDFENESDAGCALMKVDGTEFMGHTISVAISHPPEKKKNEVAPCLGGGVLKKQTSAAPFIPRSLLSKASSSSSSSSSNGKAVEAPKSNADFRNLLLKK